MEMVSPKLKTGLLLALIALAFFVAVIYRHWS
jgi:hypothetical protein